MHTGSQAGSGGQMVGTEPPDCRVLPHVHTGADCALAVHEILEGEAEVGRLVLSCLLHTFERLDEPFAESDELSAEQRSLYEVVDSFEEQGSHFIGDTSFPGAATVRHSCQLLTDLINQTKRYSRSQQSEICHSPGSSQSPASPRTRTATTPCTATAGSCRRAPCWAALSGSLQGSKHDLSVIITVNSLTCRVEGVGDETPPGDSPPDCQQSGLQAPGEGEEDWVLQGL